jgi:hypothetical protein
MRRSKEVVEGEVSQLRKEREQLDERLNRATAELGELIALEEEAQSKFVSEKVKEFQQQRDGKGSPLDAGGQR